MLVFLSFIYIWKAKQKNSCKNTIFAVYQFFALTFFKWVEIKKCVLWKIILIVGVVDNFVHIFVWCEKRCCFHRTQYRTKNRHNCLLMHRSTIAPLNSIHQMNRYHRTVSLSMCQQLEMIFFSLWVLIDLKTFK